VAVKAVVFGVTVLVSAKTVGESVGKGITAVTFLPVALSVVQNGIGTEVSSEVTVVDLVVVDLTGKASVLVDVCSKIISIDGLWGSGSDIAF